MTQTFYFPPLLQGPGASFVPSQVLNRFKEIPPPYEPYECRHRTGVSLQFGPRISSLWSFENIRDLQTCFQGLFLDPGDSSLQCLETDPEKVQEVVKILEGSGFAVYQSRIPLDIATRDHAPDKIRNQWPEDTTHWISAGASGTALSRMLSARLAKMISPERGDLLFPNTLKIAGRCFQKGDQEIDESLSLLFRRKINQGEILHAFSVPVEGFRMGYLEFEKAGSRGIRITGRVVTEEGRLAADFNLGIPSVPCSGKPWIAHLWSMNASIPGIHLGRYLHQQFIPFLMHLGVNAIKLDAGGQGRSVWPHYGYNFMDLENYNGSGHYNPREKDFSSAAETRDLIKTELLDFISSRELALSPSRAKKLSEIQEAWDVANFELIPRDEIGRRFLLSFKGILKYILWLSPDNPGLARLYRGSTPEEWDHLSPALRDELFNHFTEHRVMPQIMTSDEDHALHLLERVKTWRHAGRLSGENREDPRIQEVLKMIYKERWKNAPLALWFLREYKKLNL